MGVKVHCQWSGHATGSRQMQALFRLLADHGRPVKIHVDGGGWEEALLALAGRHRTLPIIAAHAGPGGPHAGVACVAAEMDSVFMEFASSFAALDTVRELARTIPPGRLLFGTDVPLLEPAFALGTYADADVTPATHPAVFRDTAVELFDLAPITDLAISAGQRPGTAET